MYKVQNEHFFYQDRIRMACTKTDPMIQFPSPPGHAAVQNTANHTNHDRFTDAGAKVSGAKSPYAKNVSYANDFIFADFLPACQKCSIVPNAKTKCQLCKT
jgi:hypothetical protein